MRDHSVRRILGTTAFCDGDGHPAPDGPHCAYWTAALHPQG
ncbi:hypothetical protein [Streptomyces sp. NPDC093105]